MRCFYSQDLELKLPSGHPFPMEKFRISKDMLLDGTTARIRATTLARLRSGALRP